MSAITLKDLRIQYAEHVVIDGLDLEIKEGELVCLLGPSGCGKSTMLRVMGDLTAHHGGSVLVQGRPAAEVWDSLAYVFQAARLAPWRTALGNVVLGMTLRGITGTKNELRERAQAALDTVGVAHLADRRAHALSGGEQQRVAIARALAVSPSVLLMDEPFSALDVQTRKRMRLEIVSLWKKLGLTIVLVTHDVDEALAVGSRIVVCSAKPTRILADLDVTLDHPRVADSAEVRAVHDEIVTLFDTPEAVAELEGSS